MDFTEIIEIIGKLIGVALATMILYLEPKIKNFLEAKMTSEQREKLHILVNSFVESAEQVLHDEDPTGELRKKYVIDRLRELGYVITSELDALIESKVWELNVIKRGVK